MDAERTKHAIKRAKELDEAITAEHTYCFTVVDAIHLATLGRFAKEAAAVLLKCRDALPGISLATARLMNIPLDLDKQIEALLEPWLTTQDDPNGH